MPVAPPPPVAHAAGATQFEHALVRQINAARAYCGMKQLRATARLRRVARHHTFDMIRRNTLSHDGDGTTFSTRMHRSTDYRVVGEVLAFAPGRRVGARRVVNAWLGSDEHRAELLNGSFRRVGVGTARGRIGGRRGVVITADFATRH